MHLKGLRAPKTNKMTERTTKEKTIATHYAELNRFGQNGEYERALKSANKSETNLT